MILLLKLIHKHLIIKLLCIIKLHVEQSQSQNQ